MSPLWGSNDWPSDNEDPAFITALQNIADQTGGSLTLNPGALAALDDALRNGHRITLDQILRWPVGSGAGIDCIALMCWRDGEDLGNVGAGRQRTRRGSPYAR